MVSGCTSMSPHQRYSHSTLLDHQCTGDDRPRSRRRARPDRLPPSKRPRRQNTVWLDTVWLDIDSPPVAKAPPLQSGALTDWWLGVPAIPTCNCDLGTPSRAQRKAAERHVPLPIGPREIGRFSSIGRRESRRLILALTFVLALIVEEVPGTGIVIPLRLWQTFC